MAARCDGQSRVRTRGAQVTSPDTEHVFPARALTVAEWLSELSMSEELLCDMEEHSTVMRFLYRWRFLWDADNE